MPGGQGSRAQARVAVDVRGLQSGAPQLSQRVDASLRSHPAAVSVPIRLPVRATGARRSRSQAWLAAAITPTHRAASWRTMRSGSTQETVPMTLSRLPERPSLLAKLDFRG